MRFDLTDIVMGMINVYIAIATAVAVAAVMAMLWTFIVSMIRRQYDKLGCCLLPSLLCVVIAAASWVFNAGFMRLLMTVLGVPHWHAAFFLTYNIQASAYLKKSSQIKRYIWLICLFYEGTYLLFPDIDNVRSYFFFGLIQIDWLYMIMAYLAVACLIIHLIMMSRLRALRKTLQAEEKANMG
ncbi:MAG: hypothetical protein IJX53_08470 [Clostridia bacterium]|nr:hypothetical protein [Clostridia bacterium]